MRNFAVLVVSFALAVAPERGTSQAPDFKSAMEASMNKMHHSMASAPFHGDADQDFAAMMIPHHRGAIDMAKAELQYGKDPVMRRLAQGILVEQQSEIDAMQLWLSKKASGKAR